MGKITVNHHKMLGPNRVRTTAHFTRTDMREAWARGMRLTAKQLPSKDIVVWEGEDVVIVERNLT